MENKRVQENWAPAYGVLADADAMLVVDARFSQIRRCVMLIRCFKMQKRRFVIWLNECLAPNRGIAVCWRVVAVEHAVRRRWESSVPNASAPTVTAWDVWRIYSELILILVGNRGLSDQARIGGRFHWSRVPV